MARAGRCAMTLLIGTASFLIAIWTVRIDRTAGVLCAVEPILGAAGRRDAGLHRSRCRVSASHHAQAGCRVRGCANVAGVAGRRSMIAAGVILIDSTRVFPGLWVLLPVARHRVAADRRRDRALDQPRACCRMPLVVWVGLISYPLYLWHWPLLSFARILATATPPAAIRLARCRRQRGAGLADLSR